MPIQQVRQKSKAEAFGDIFGGVTGGILKGKMLKRNQAMEDAMKIWQMAQQDPLIMQNPQVPKIFASAGLPMPNIREPMSVEQAFSQAPEGYEAVITVDPRTGTEKITYKPKDWASDYWKMTLMEKYPELFPDNGGLPAPGGSESLIDSLNRGPNNVPSAPLPTSTPVPNVNLRQIPKIGEMALQAEKGFLEPDILPPLEGLVGKGRPSKPSRPFFGKPTMPSAVDSLIPGMGTGMGAGAIAPSPSGRPMAPSIAPQIATAEPKTIAEFEDNIRIIAKTDKKKAKEYYEKWKSKW